MYVLGITFRVLCVVVLFSACAEEAEESEIPDTTYAQPEEASYASGRSSVKAPQLSFTDITDQSGIDFLHENGAVGDKWMPETMGSGCALFDYDEDGDLDVLLVNGQSWNGKGRPARN